MFKSRIRAAVCHFGIPLRQSCGISVFYTKNFELFYGGAKKIRNFADRINHIRSN